MSFLVRFKKEGKIYEKKFYAKDENALYEKLDKEKFFVLEIHTKPSFFEIFNASPKTKDLLGLFYQLKLGLQAKTPLLAVLENACLQIQNPLLKRRFKKVIFGVKAGKDIANCFKGADFSDFICSMLEVGNKSGKLIESFGFISINLKKKQKNEKLLKKILLYPSFISVVMILVFLNITLFVLPQFESLFLSLDSDLPIASKSLLFMRSFVLEWGVFSLLGIGVLIFVCMRIYKHYVFLQEKMACFILSFPLFGKVVYHYQMSQFLLSFYWLYKSGVPLEEVLNISCRSVDNKYLNLKIENVYKSMMKGACVAESFENSGILDSWALGMIRSAQSEEGFLEALEVILEIHQEELQSKSDTLIASLEPLMILFLGLLVLWLALGIFLPLWELPLHLKGA